MFRHSGAELHYLYVAMVAPLADTAFREWLQANMDARTPPINANQLAAYLHTSPAVIYAWINRGAEPRPESCRRLAELFNVPQVEVFRYAGLITDSQDETAGIIPEAAALLRQMTEAEQRLYGVRVLRLGLELIADSKTEVEASPEAERPAPAPPDRRRPRK